MLFGLLTLEGALGVATLQADQQPLVLSIVHQACAIAVLAAALDATCGRSRSPRQARSLGSIAGIANKSSPIPARSRVLLPPRPGRFRETAWAVFGQGRLGVVISSVSH